MSAVFKLASGESERERESCADERRIRLTDSVMDPGSAAVLAARSGRADCFQLFEVLVLAFRKCNGLETVETLRRH